MVPQAFDHGTVPQFIIEYGRTNVISELVKAFPTANDVKPRVESGSKGEIIGNGHRNASLAPKYANAN